MTGGLVWLCHLEECSGWVRRHNHRARGNLELPRHTDRPPAPHLRHAQQQRGQQPGVAVLARRWGAQSRRRGVASARRCAGRQR